MTELITISLTKNSLQILNQLKTSADASYDEVIGNLFNTSNDSNHGVIFLNTVYVEGELKRLVTPIPLELYIHEDKMISLSNDEYSILVTCSSLADGLEEARLEFSDEYAIFCDESIPDAAASAKKYGEKLKHLVGE